MIWELRSFLWTLKHMTLFLTRKKRTVSGYLSFTEGTKRRRLWKAQRDSMHVMTLERFVDARDKRRVFGAGSLSRLDGRKGKKKEPVRQTNVIMSLTAKGLPFTTVFWTKGFQTTVKWLFWVRKGLKTEIHLLEFYLFIMVSGLSFLMAGFLPITEELETGAPHLHPGIRHDMSLITIEKVLVPFQMDAGMSLNYN